MKTIIDEMEVAQKAIDEKVIKVFLEDEFFYTLKDYIEKEDYALAKDATKGLYNLAGQLSLFRLYELLLDMYEDLEYEEYKDLMAHYEKMIVEYEHLKEVYHD